MKNCFGSITVVLWFFLWSSICATEPVTVLDTLLKQTKQCVQQVCGVQELQYNKRIKSFFYHCRQLHAQDNLVCAKDIGSLIKARAVVLDEYACKSDEHLKALVLCSTVHELYGLLGAYSDHLIQTLVLIDAALGYWYEQELHPYHYFFHKSPFKWFNGQRQSAEVRKNIACLERNKHDYCTQLGALLLQVEACACADESTMLAWADSTLDMLCQLHGKQYTSNASFDDRLRMTGWLYKKSGHCMQRIQNKLSANGLLIPLHVQRHWLFYSSLVLSAAYGIWYVSTHHEKMAQAQKALSVMRSEIYNDLRRPILGFKEAFLQDSHGKEARVMELWKNLEEEREVFINRAMKFFPDVEYKLEDRMKIENNLRHFKTVDISDRYLSKMDGNKWSKLWNSPDIGAGIIYEINGLKLNLFSMINEVYNELFKNVRGNKFTIAVASSVPLYGIFIGICALLNKTYSTIFYRWFNALKLQTTIKKIHNLFIAAYYQKEIEPAFYGNLMYLLMTLKQQAHCVTKHQKAEFIRDCNQLAQVTMTVQQKIEIIKNMRMYYSYIC